MGVIDAINETSSKALDSGQEYAKVSQEYYKLKAFQQVALSFSFLTKMAIIGGIFFLGLIFLSVSLALWLGQLIGSTLLACLVLAGMLFLMTLICYLARKSIDAKIIRKMSKEFFD